MSDAYDDPFDRPMTAEDKEEYEAAMTAASLTAASYRRKRAQEWAERETRPMTKSERHADRERVKNETIVEVFRGLESTHPDWPLSLVTKETCDRIGCEDGRVTEAFSRVEKKGTV